MSECNTVTYHCTYVATISEIAELRARLADRDRQLAVVREWMAEHAHEPGAKYYADHLRQRLEWADVPVVPSSGAIAVTASLFERVANLEDQAERVDKHLGHLPGMTGVCVRAMVGDIKDLQATVRGLQEECAALRDKLRAIQNRQQ